MAAPSNTVWGDTVGGYGRIGISATVSSTAELSTVHIEVWFWSKYGVSDSSNQYYYNNNATSATTLIGSRSIKTTVNSGGGWSTSNQVLVAETSNDYEYSRGTSAVKRNVAAKLSGIDRVGGAMYVTTSYTIPARSHYTVSYNANGGSGAPSAQTKWYGTTLKLSTTKPTRSGYTFRGWGTSTSDTSVDYAPGANYTGNANLTLYAIWTRISYTVAYNANGGTGAPKEMKKNHGEAITLSTTKPTRTNYTFSGWGTSASDTSVDYNPGSKYTANASITLYAIWKVAYVKPRINNYKASRCTSTGETSDDGTYVKITCDWSTDKTVSAIKIDWKLTTDASYDTANSDTVANPTGTSGTVSIVVGKGAISTDNAYNFKITISDSVGNNNQTIIVRPKRYPIDFLKGGTGVAFGKPAVKTATVDSAWPIHSTHTDLGFCHQRDDTGSIVYFGIGSGGYNRGLFDQYDEHWMLWRNRDGYTTLYGDDIYLQSKNSGASYVPYYKPGDKIAITGADFAGAGHITGSGGVVYFMMPLAKPTLGVSAVIATSSDGMIIRQESKYLYGSSATKYVNPDEYRCTLLANNCVRVIANFSVTTNVMNNAPCGIIFNGTLTFE